MRRYSALFCFLLFLVSLLWAGLATATTVDVLVVYDTTAKKWLDGKQTGMLAFALEAATRMNQATRNSGIDLTFRVTHVMASTYKTTYGSSDSMSDDLDALKNGSGKLNKVPTARNTYHADLVTMMIDTGSAYGKTGKGSLLMNWNGNPNAAFSVVSIRAVDHGHTLTHEFGHNFGAHHAKTQTHSPGPNEYLDNEYSAGYYFTGTDNTKYHTIMAYSSDGHGNHYEHTDYFSTPLRKFKGKAVGIKDDCDNARLIRQTMDSVASYRNLIKVSANGGNTVTIASSTGHGGTTAYSFTVAKGKQVKLTAPAQANGQPFTGWTGNITSNNQTISFTPTKDMELSANYAQPAQSYTLTVNSSGATDVPITSSTGHGGTTNYSKTVNKDTRVTLTAPPEKNGKKFNGWTGSITSSNKTISLTVDNDMNMTANYTQPAPTTYSLTVNSSGATNVPITSSTGHGGTTNYSKTVNKDTRVTLTAPPEKNGKKFNGWTGSITSSNKTISLTVDNDMTVTANYTQPAPTTYSLTVNSSGATNVSITSSTGHGGTTNYSKTVNKDTRVTLTAPPEKNGKKFNGWTGDSTSRNRSIHFIANKDMRLIALYGSSHSGDTHKSHFPWNLFLTTILNGSRQ